MSTEPTLYHYVHCPYCVRVRLALGFLSIKFNSVVLPYDDEKTPISLADAKMLPIFKFDESHVSNESLDIIAILDTENRLGTRSLLDNSEKLGEINTLLSEISKPVHNMAMPYWIYTPEFDDNSRKYFKDKKEVKRGPLKRLIPRRPEFEQQLSKVLDGLELQIDKFFQSEAFTIADIMIASHLWGMYVVPEYQFPAKIHEYLQNIKRICEFDYHKDFWS
ncbi:MAG: hypothetical protein HOE90_16855 [Bacteriovoracaceae bacterium]|jgi:glutaredoxin 2|nr:hypothetical protein [Bacteriovoracaceae bacterium]